jgi:hypothetical protein
MIPLSGKFGLLNQREELDDDTDPEASQPATFPPSIIQSKDTQAVPAPASLLQSALARLANEPLSGIASVLVMEIRVLVVLYVNDRLQFVRALLDNAYAEGTQEEFVVFTWGNHLQTIPQVRESTKWIAKKTFKWQVSPCFCMWVVQDAFVTI